MLMLMLMMIILLLFFKNRCVEDRQYRIFLRKLVFSLFDGTLHIPHSLYYLADHLLTFSIHTYLFSRKKWNVTFS